MGNAANLHLIRGTGWNGSTTASYCVNGSVRHCMFCAHKPDLEETNCTCTGRKKINFQMDRGLVASLRRPLPALAAHGVKWDGARVRSGTAFGIYWILRMSRCASSWFGVRVHALEEIWFDTYGIMRLELPKMLFSWRNCCGRLGHLNRNAYAAFAMHHQNAPA